MLELFELELELPLLDEFELLLLELFDDELFEEFELVLFEEFELVLFELFELVLLLELLDDRAGAGAGAGGGAGAVGGGGGTVSGTVGGGSVVGASVVGATVVGVGGVVVVVDVELSEIGAGVSPSSPSARIVPVVTAAARPTAPIALARIVHRGRRVGRIVVVSLNGRHGAPAGWLITTMRWRP